MELGYSARLGRASHPYPKLGPNYSPRIYIPNLRSRHTNIMLYMTVEPSLARRTKVLWQA